MAFQRGIDGPDPPRARPVSALPGAYEDRHSSRAWQLAATLACPRCDAPVALGGYSVTLTQDLGCPFCHHCAAARDFLSLAAPTRPTHVAVRMFRRARERRGSLRA